MLFTLATPKLTSKFSPKPSSTRSNFRCNIALKHKVDQKAHLLTSAAYSQQSTSRHLTFSTSQGFVMPPAHPFNRRTIGHCMGTLPTSRSRLIITIMIAVFLITPPVFSWQRLLDRGLVSIPGQFVWVSWHWDRFLAFYFSLPLSVSFHARHFLHRVWSTVWCGQLRQILVCMKVNTQNEAWISIRAVMCIIASVYCSVHHLE